MLGVRHEHHSQAPSGSGKPHPGWRAVVRAVFPVAHVYGRSHATRAVSATTVDQRLLVDGVFRFGAGALGGNPRQREVALTCGQPSVNHLAAFPGRQQPHRTAAARRDDYLRIGIHGQTIEIRAYWRTSRCTEWRPRHATWQFGSHRRAAIGELIR